jgi:threonine aldolase
MIKTVDLRSDTVTVPTPEMREAMAHALCGDDVYGDDPTANRLEAMAAERMGKQAAMFVPSGTMANLVAILTHCCRGDEMIVGEYAHIFYDEAGGAACLGGVQPYNIRNSADGTMPLDVIEAAIRPDDIHYARSRLICLENTQSECGGTPLTVDYTRSVGELAHSHGLKLHLDGARIFNAAVALGVPAKELAEPADSVMFCISKGLCAPIGSILCGTEDFIVQARRARKQLGGGMRQVGILAAAGIVALETMVDRLGDDHRRAQELAAGLVDIPGITVENTCPPTNHVFIQVSPELATAAELLESLQQNGVLGLEEGPTRVRFLTHYWIDDGAIQRAIAAFRETVKVLQAA